VSARRATSRASGHDPTTPPVRVLAISSYGVLGGAEIAMAGFLAHRPVDVDARVLLVDDGPLSARLRSQGLEVIALRDYGGRPGPSDVRRFAVDLDQLLKRWAPQVVWACGQKAAMLSVFPCRRRGVPLVWHKVDFSWDRSLGRPLAVAVDGLVAVSHAVVAPIGAVGARRNLGVVGVPVTLDPSFRATPDQDRPIIGTLARLVPYKGVDRMIRAVALLRAEFPGLRLRVAGGVVPEFPEHRAELATLAARLGLADAVELRGFVEDVTEVLRDMTVFVNATYRDHRGFGLEALSASILEASFAGVPVVAPATGGIGEAVIDHLTGTLVSSPEPELLAAAIARYLNDPHLRRRTSEAGRAWAQDTFAPAAASTRLYGALRAAATAS
jgi:glycosyltransferase involved in cell wall biosynthesis